MAPGRSSRQEVTCDVKITHFDGLMDEGRASGVLFLDLRKAFDTVHHGILVDKLHLLGFHDRSVEWFTSYLTHRKQVTKLNGVISEEAFISYGVPQGSILGPMLFSLYVNDLPEHILNGYISLYADDTAICVSDTDPVCLKEKLMHQLQIVKSWYQRNKLSLNLDKTKIMIFGTAGNLAKMTDVHVPNVERVDSFKYLGMKLDSLLNFSENVSYIKGKTLPKLKLLGRLSYSLDSTTLLTLYKTLIVPIFDFGDACYHRMTQADGEMLQRLQNMACRAILKVNSYAHISDMHDTLDIATLYQRRCQHICNTMHKFLNGNGPPECVEMFKYIHEVHHVPTRNATGHLLSIPQTRLRTSERDFAIVGPTVWNQVPMEIRMVHSHDKFKKLVKTVIFT